MVGSCSDQIPRCWNMSSSQVSALFSLGLSVSVWPRFIYLVYNILRTFSFIWPCRPQSSPSRELRWSPTECRIPCPVYLLLGLPGHGSECFWVAYIRSREYGSNSKSSELTSLFAMITFFPILAFLSMMQFLNNSNPWSAIHEQTSNIVLCSCVFFI